MIFRKMNKVEDIEDDIRVQEVARIKRYEECGVEWVECLSAQSPDDAAVCQAEEGKRYRIDQEKPEIPHKVEAGGRVCRCLYVPSDDQ